jgi:hypothetical protein
MSRFLALPQKSGHFQAAFTGDRAKAQFIDAHKSHPVQQSDRARLYARPEGGF